MVENKFPMAVKEPVLVTPDFASGVSWRFLYGIGHQLDIIFALTLGAVIWHLPVAPALDERGMRFLATLAVAVVFWVRESYDEYVVGLMLLFSWVVFGIAPTGVALSGFAKSSFIFVIAALGLGAAVNHIGLLSRVASQILMRVPLSFYRTHLFLILGSGLLLTPLLPTGKARTVIGIPMGQAISDSSGFAPRSNGSAALTLAALVGFSQLSFVFLTGGEFCLIGWNLLPTAAKSEFGWTAWFLAAAPAGVFTLLFVLIAVQWLFPLRLEDRERIENAKPPVALKISKPFSRAEWIVVITLSFTVIGWLTMPIHGFDEAWVALAGLLVLHVTGVLNKEIFIRKLDWGLILFFAIVTSMAEVTSHLKLDRWLIAQIEPTLSYYALGPLVFLAVIVVLVNIARLFVRKSAAVTFFIITMVPVAETVGVHPGALLLTVVMASESFFLS